MKRKNDVKWSMQNGKCKRKQPLSISFGTHIISFPHHDIQKHQKNHTDIFLFIKTQIPPQHRPNKWINNPIIKTIITFIFYVSIFKYKVKNIFPFAQYPLLSTPATQNEYSKREISIPKSPHTKRNKRFTPF